MNRIKVGKTVLISLCLLLIGLLWATNEVASDNLLLDVPEVKLISWLESRFTYFYLHLFTVVPVFLLSFDKKVHYHTQWRFLLPAIGIVGLAFILWDVYFTAVGVWGFNHNYLSGAFLLGLPIEEWLFFLTVPFACVFIYECLNFYLKTDLLKKLEPWLSKLLVVLFLGVGFYFWSHLYSSTTFLLAGFFLLFHLLFMDGSYRSRFYLAYLVSWLPFMLVNGVLTGGYTQEPVVIYNPEEYLGIRITSVPLDDSVYSFLLLFSTITLYEGFRKEPELSQKKTFFEKN